MTPQDQWDLDEPNANVLVDLEIDGQTRKALVRAARNGFFYVFDRATGEMLLEPWMFVYNDIFDGVNMETGRPRYDMTKMMFTDLEDRPAVRAGRGEHRHRLVSRHRRQELAERRVLPADRTPVHPDLEQLRSPENGRRRVRARERLHAP